jgi:hypothetical protein
MLCIKQMAALAVFLSMLAVSYFILPSIRKSIHIQKPRKFHNKTLFRIARSPQSFGLDDHHSDVDIDLEP